MSFIVLKNRENYVPGTPQSIPGKDAVLKTLAYFDIFHYPLTRTEVKRFLSLNADDISLATWLAELEAEKKIFYSNGFYSLQDNPLLAPRRIAGNKKAELLLGKALKIGGFLYKFPFVKAVGISGSLSKNYADEKSDIDFFIITKRGRLWISRTLMHLYKKLTYITGRQHYYCMNYYVDETALALTDRNIFSAIELKTLGPVCGKKTFIELFSQNQWADEYFPACGLKKQLLKDRGQSWLKKSGEWLLNNKIGDWLENYLMIITQKRWKIKEERGKRNEKGIAMGLISGKHFARSNPGGLQEKILKAYDEKVNTITCKEERPAFVISSAK